MDPHPADREEEGYMTKKKNRIGIEALALAGLLLLPRVLLAADAADGSSAAGAKSDDSATNAQAEATPAAKSHKHHRHHKAKDTAAQPSTGSDAGSSDTAPSGGSESTGGGD
jgi:hypothetical protein